MIHQMQDGNGLLALLEDTIISKDEDVVRAIVVKLCAYLQANTSFTLELNTPTIRQLFAKILSAHCCNEVIFGCIGKIITMIAPL